MAEAEHYLTSVGAVLEGIAQQIGHHLVEVDTVNPCLCVRLVTLDMEIDVS
jgi:hypothetical protein